MRKILFWTHLTAGVTAALVILIMSVSGVLLMYERQMIAWTDRDFTSKPPTPGSVPLEPEALLDKVRESQRSLPAAINVHAGHAAPIELTYGSTVVYVDKYSGQHLGEGSKSIRAFFRTVTDWHRWLAMQGQNRSIGKAITGASNLAFLVLVVSGMFIWLPRKLSWQHVRPVLAFRGGLSGRARNFNWHNVIGIWSAIPLFFIVLGALVISYPWATNLLYRVTGSDPPPAPASSAAAGAGRSREDRPIDFSGLNSAWNRAVQQVPGWQTINFRVPTSSKAPFVFAMLESHRGRPDKRSSVTIDRATGNLVQLETFSGYNLGRRLRMWLRFIHTGEALGVAGQTVAGLVSAGAAVMVWTGIALALRRFKNWRGRQRVSSKDQDLVQA